MNPADITETLHKFNAEDSRYVVNLLGVEVGAEIIRDLEEDVRVKFLKQILLL